MIRHTTSIQVGIHEGKIAYRLSFDEGEEELHLFSLDAAQTLADETNRLLRQLRMIAEGLQTTKGGPTTDRLGLHEEVRMQLWPPTEGEHNGKA